MCAVCHGRAGEGYKADQAPALAHPDFLASVTDDYLRTAIVGGRSGTTMSAWGIERGGPLSKGDVDALVVFLRSWQQRPQATLDERPVRGDAARGGELYARECAGCHGAHGTGGPDVNIGGSELLTTASVGFLRYAIGNGRAGTAMPSFRGRLGDHAIEDLVALLQNWKTLAANAPRPPPVRPPPIPLGPVPLNPKGPEPEGLRPFPSTSSADLVKAQLDRGARMALLDARAPSDYSNEHIAGAVSVPFYDPDRYFDDLPKDAWLVSYCACPHAESTTLAQKLVAAGFTKVTVLDEGLGFWKRKKYGTHTGQEP